MRNGQGRIAQVDVTPADGTGQVLVKQIAYASFGPSFGWTYGNERRLLRPLDQDYRSTALQDTTQIALEAAGKILMVMFGFLQDQVKAPMAARTGMFKPLGVDT